ncbi:MAG TPA: apolipoprotein N-acyltransferase [Gemmatimonadaceae bacterium]|nr:apolipoprotein N-acyltransferase [Gemmatimonadaceae bacterium]
MSALPARPVRNVPEPTPTPRRAASGLLVELVGPVASALLFAVAFPPYGLVLPAVLALVPLGLGMARHASTLRPLSTGLRIGLPFGAAWYAVGIHWLVPALGRETALAPLVYVVVLAAVGLAVGLATTVALIGRRATALPLALLLPAAWTSAELVLEWMPGVTIPWLPLGLALAPQPLAAQAVELSGVHGGSFLVAALAGLLADAWLVRDRLRAVVARLALAASVAGAVLGFGALRLGTLELAPLANVAVVQPAIGLDEKHDPALLDRNVGRLVALTHDATSASRPALVLWPETALAGFLAAHPAWHDSLRAAARGRAPILFGVVDLRPVPVEHSADIYNAVMLTDRAGRVLDAPVYHKRVLVPIVERVPFVNPAWWTGGDPRTSRGFAVGERPRPFQLPFGAVGTLICYESAIPRLARQWRRDGVALLANLTNDAWFQRGGGAYQHLAHLQLRAIETRLPVVRAANTGISAYIDPLGRIHRATGFDEAVARTYHVERTGGTTLYIRFGDWIGLGSLGVCGALLLVGWRRRATGAAGTAGPVRVAGPPRRR